MDNPAFSSWNGDSNFQFCVHCSSPFNDEEEIGIKVPSRRVLMRALTIIFKLNYLNAFDVLQSEKTQVEGQLGLWCLCSKCRLILNNLYDLYKEFLFLGTGQSYLLKQIKRIDDIMNNYLQSEINQTIQHPQVKQEPDSGSENESHSSSNCDDHNSNSNSELQDHQNKVKGHPLGSRKEVRVALKRISVKSKFIQIKEDPEFDDLKFETHSVDSNDSEDYSRGIPEIKIGAFQNPSEDGIQITSTNSSSNCPPQTQPNLKPHKRKLLSNPTTSFSSPSRKRIKKDVLNLRYLSKRTFSPYPCWYCKKRDFESTAECLQHTQKEHLPKFQRPSLARICSRCTRICSNDESLQSHLIQCEKIPIGVILPKKFSCSVCSRPFGCEKDVEKHEMTHKDERRFPCDECPYKAKLASLLKLHKERRHEANADVKVSCDECGSVLKNERILKTHKYHMHTPEGYKKYRDAQEILLAKLREKKKANPKLLDTRCWDCNVDFFSRLGLVNHRRTFHGDNMGKEFVCETCGRDFTTSNSLKLHKRRHLSDRPFVCENCGKSFKFNCNLKSHFVQTHTEEGRLKYNEKTRERNRRRKLLADQLANVGRPMSTS